MKPCGAGHDIVDPEMRKKIFGKEDHTKHHATGDSMMVELPDSVSIPGHCKLACCNGVFR